jgi:protein-disulfide isomerase
LAPAVIIVIVLALTVGGMAYLYSTSKPPTNVASNTNGTNRPANASSTPRSQSIPANAPPGAAPVYAKGDPTAVVTIEEFADFQCPTCASVNPAMKEIQAAFAGNKNVRFIFRHLPLTQIHDKTMDASSAVEAAGMQGQPKFWSMMDLMLTNQQEWASSPNYRELWRGYAERIGLDVPRWEADASGMAVRGRIDLDTARARAIGVSSTPTVYLNGSPVPLADLNIATMRPMIEAAIADATKPATPANSNAASGNSNTAN